MFRKPAALQAFFRMGGKTMVDEILACDRTMRRYDRKYAIKRRRNVHWHSLGAIVNFTPYERGLRVQCEHGWVELHWVAADCLRVRMQPQSGDFMPPFSYAVQKVDWPVVPIEYGEREDSLEMRTPNLICRVGKRPFRLLLEMRNGRRVCMDTSGMKWSEDGQSRLSMAMHPDETSYGLGERATGLNLRGSRYSFWNTDPQKHYERGSDPLYYNIPFYLGLHDEIAYGLFWDNASRGAVDLAATVPNEMTFEAESGELRYYLFADTRVNEVISRYTELTGRISLPPLWALGYHQSRFSYYPQQSVMELAAEFRKREIPCDVLHLDIHYMNESRVFTWDRQRFPNFIEMTDELHGLGFKVITIVDPGVKIDKEYEVYKSGIHRNVFIKYPDNALFTGVVWPGACHFPDFTNPAARSWWTEQSALLLRTGIDGLWNDMCEPAIFGAEGVAETLPDYLCHDQDGLSGTHLQNHNVYGMLMARSSMEALEKHRPEKRPVNIVRAGYAGTQRYALSWTGDNQATWDHLKLSISMTLNMGLSGSPMIGPDIGGFHGDPSPELFTRWLQAACLMPFFRNHAASDTAAQEPWAYGQPYELINRLTIQLRYRLLPYLYSVIALCHEYGWPVVRPVFMAEPGNPALRSIDDAYLLGDSLLVAPVLTMGAIRREVYLPRGQWYDFWTNEQFQGGQKVMVAAPLERLPLFVKAGTVLPMWPEMLYVGEKPLEMLTLRAYPGSADTVLYEDAGEGKAYLEGDYRWIYTTCTLKDSIYTLTRRVAGKYKPEYKTIRVEVVGLDEEPASVRVDRQSAPLWFYDAGVLEITTDDTFGKIEVVEKSQPDDRTIMRRSW